MVLQNKQMSLNSSRAEPQIQNLWSFERKSRQKPSSASHCLPGHGAQSAGGGRAGRWDNGETRNRANIQEGLIRVLRALARPQVKDGGESVTLQKPNRAVWALPLHEHSARGTTRGFQGNLSQPCLRRGYQGIPRCTLARISSFHTLASQRRHAHAPRNPRRCSPASVS